MKYVGSKNNISKYLVPVIQNYINQDTEGYLEPFVGGANIIDKIQCKKKIGSDIHKQLIALLNYAKDNWQILPSTISEEEYNKVKNDKESYPDWYIGLVGFCATFATKYFGGYARAFKNDKVTPRDMPNEAIRNLQNQAPKLRNISFINYNFLDLPIDKIKNYVIYCDIPYKDTTKYATNEFPYDKFYEWCIKASKKNVVLISEYDMPKDKFQCIWEMKYSVNFDSNRKNSKERIEKLFIVKS